MQVAQPLLAGARDSASADADLESTSAGGLPPDSICRICLEGGDNVDDAMAPERLIAPCSCKGTSLLVHRGCLDRWRAVREDRAFSQCTECIFRYEFVRQRIEDDENTGFIFAAGPLTAKRRRRLRFQFFVARDFFVAFVVMQLAIWTIGGLVRLVDCGSFLCRRDAKFAAAVYNRSKYWRHHEQADFDAIADYAQFCCPRGLIVNEMFPAYFGRHTQSAYYLVGLVLFMAIVGVFGVCSKRTSKCDDCHTNDCAYYGCYIDSSPSYGQNDCNCCCGDCGDCNCNDCDCNGDNCNGDGDGGEALAILAVIVLALIVVFAFIGLLEGVVFFSVLMQRSMQKHLHVLQKKAMTEKYVVEDLSARPAPGRSLEEITAQRVRAAPSAPPMAMQPSPSAPPMHRSSCSDLHALGLM